MQIYGKCKIANKWVNNEIDKNQFDFENKGMMAIGTLQWSDVKKGKNGAKDEFTTTTKRFITFDSGNIDLIQSSLGQNIMIEGKLQGSSYTDKEGKKKKNEQVIIDKVSLAEGSISKHSVDKGNGYVAESNQDEEGDDSEIPF
jgi:single-stranded DNA-binding protein